MVTRQAAHSLHVCAGCSSKKSKLLKKKSSEEEEGTSEEKASEDKVHPTRSALAAACLLDFVRPPGCLVGVVALTTRQSLLAACTEAASLCT